VCRVDDVKKMILVVEDVAEIRESMSLMLHARGHDVVSALNAEEAIKIAEQRRPAMILTDLDLPTLGFLMRQIRGRGDLKDMRVAIIDVDHPEVSLDYDMTVLSDFDQLDALIQSLP